MSDSLDILQEAVDQNSAFVLIQKLELQESNVKHEELQRGWALIYITSSSTDVPLFIDKLLLRVLLETEGLDAGLQVKRVNFQILGGYE